MTDSKKETPPEPAAKLGSADLAELIVDALIDAGIVHEKDMNRAVEITAEEIDVRKALGDY